MQECETTALSAYIDVIRFCNVSWTGVHITTIRRCITLPEYKGLSRVGEKQTIPWWLIAGKPVLWTPLYIIVNSVTVKNINVKMENNYDNCKYI